MDANLILMMVQDKLPKDPMSVMNLRDRLGKMSDAKRDELARQLPILGLKNPTLVFWVGSFLFGYFGVGRFYKGDIGRGLLYILCFVVVFVFLTITNFAANEFNDGVAALYIFAYFLFLAFIAVVYLDCYLIYKGIQKDNFVKFQNFLLLNFRGVR